MRLFSQLLRDNINIKFKIVKLKIVKLKIILNFFTILIKIYIRDKYIQSNNIWEIVSKESNCIMV